MLSNKRILDITAYTIIFFICYMVFISTFAKESAVRLPFYYKQINKYTIQQGWAFFTRDPREPSFNLYTFDSKNNIVGDKIIKPNTHYSNLFGISRKSRRLGIEMSVIIPNIKKEQWKSVCCISSISLNNQNKVPISNPMIKYLGGNYIVIKEKRIPWVYFSNKNEFKYDIEYAFIQIK